MKTTKTLTFFSLLLIACMLTAPLILATGGSFAGSAGGFTGSYAGSPGGFSGGSFTGSPGGFIGSFGGAAGGFNGGTTAGTAGGFTGGGYGGSMGTTPTSIPTNTPSTPSIPTFVSTPPTGIGNPTGGPTPGNPTGYPTNVDAVWQSLSDVTIYQGATSGTTIQQNIFSKCSDPDDKNLEFKITSKSDNFKLAFSESDLKIYNLKTAFIGKEIITIECNKVPESFALNVIPRQITPTPTATSSDDGDGISVFIGAIRLPEESTAGEQIPILISFKNSGDKKLENVKAAVVITDLGVRASIGPFDLTKGKSISKTIYVELPEDTQTGTYTARITIDSSSVHRVKHRDVEVIA